MSDERRVEFRDYLPAAFVPDGDHSPARLFLLAFEMLFEELQLEIEGLDGSAQSGGIPDLFNPQATPPAEFDHLGAPDLDYLSYLASWIGLPLRTDKSIQWNRVFFQRAIQLYPQRGTLPGIRGMLEAWLAGEVTRVVIDDFAAAGSTSPAPFPFFFTVTLTLNSGAAGIAVMEAASLLLDREKPAHTSYGLRISGGSMQLAPSPPTSPVGFAQIGVTTRLNGALIFEILTDE
jgi:phage tail-like protein